ncbi:lytic transglycosylase domain-containing protein [Porphyrobacter sp. GA68]|uniref:lytic transglycosylase domain-containing protein n=1 Tax=Porphyrobacter sp. GA68 TaxID=2883480 RepID=UPI001D187338|nr:lytic transglycosylase domain-containing protein [Porphyrobacter sp. GA68]
MMKISFATVLLASAVIAAPVSAQQVQLMNFDGAESGVVLNVGPSSRTEVPPASVQSLENALATDFGAIGAPVLQDTNYVVEPSRIDVPLWMRSGVPTGRMTIPSVGSLGSVAGNCAQPVYRPRGDLAATTEQRRAALFPLIAAIACEQNIPVGLFDALVAQESRYNRTALSPVGAMGLAQLMPGTARYLGVTNPWDVVQNLRGGAKYLREQLDEFGRVDLALAAYNAGPGRVRQRRAVPRILETLNYVATITSAWSGATRQVELVRADQPSVVRNPFRQAAVLAYTSPSTANPM